VVLAALEKVADINNMNINYVIYTQLILMSFQ